MKEEFKHLVVRKPEDINKEYSEILWKLGALRTETAEIERLNKLHLDREKSIETEEETHLKRILELKIEMTESQREIQRKTEEQKPAEQVSP